MERRRPLISLFLVATLLAAAVGVWALTRGGEPLPPAAEIPIMSAAPVLEADTSLPDAALVAAGPAGGSAREALEPPVVEIEEPDDPEEDEDFEEITEEPEHLPVPDDPPETGECTLQLYLVDRETGQRIAGKVELWRLDAPANEDWSRGDQLQTTLGVEPEGRVVEDLPAGVYRPYVQSAARASEFAPSFAVQGRWTTQEVTVTRALLVESTLVMIDEQGQRLEAAEIQVGRLSSGGVATAPPWRAKRTLLATGNFYHVGGGWGGSGGRHSWRSWTAGPDGFPLAKLRTDTRERSYTQHVGLRTEGGLRLNLDCSVVEATPGPVILVASYPTRERLLEGVVLPGGTPLTEVERVSVTVRGDAALLSLGADAAAVARDVPYEVSIALAGYDVLKFEWRLTDEGGGIREMIPASQ